MECDSPEWIVTWQPKRETFSPVSMCLRVHVGSQESVRIMAAGPLLNAGWLDPFPRIADSLSQRTIDVNDIDNVLPEKSVTCFVFCC